MEKKITKIYVTSNQKLTEYDLCYLVSSNKCFPMSIRRLAGWSWIVEIEYEKHKNLLDLLKTNKIRNKEVSVKRIFKSINRLSNFFKKVPSKGFLLQVAMGISGLIDKPILIKITNNRAGNWQKELTKIWQKEIDTPNIFKKAGINNVIDITPKGDIEFRIIKGENYIVTFFSENIDKYTKFKDELEKSK